MLSWVPQGGGGASRQSDRPYVFLGVTEGATSWGAESEQRCRPTKNFWGNLSLTGRMLNACRNDVLVVLRRRSSTRTPSLSLLSTTP